jgi:hypothetical protein
VRPSFHTWFNKDAVAAYAFLVPNVVGFVLFTAAPVLMS